MKKPLLVIVLLVVSFWYADGVTALTVFSPIVEITAAPGEAPRGIVKVFNESDQPVELRSVIEQFTTDDQSGSPRFIALTESNPFLKWFKLDQDELVLLPRQVAVIPFTVSVPPNATPGGYFAAIFWEIVPAAGSGDVSISGRVGTLVFLEVSGEVVRQGVLESLTRTPSNALISGFPVSFSVLFNNTGTIHLKPSGSIIITNSFGQSEILSVNPDARNVLPDSSRRFDVVWGQPAATGNILERFWQGVRGELSSFRLGQYTVTVTLYGDVSKAMPMTATQTFWFVPVYLSSIAGGFMLCALFLMARRRNKKRKNVLHAPSGK